MQCKFPHAAYPASSRPDTRVEGQLDDKRELKRRYGRDTWQHSCRRKSAVFDRTASLGVYTLDPFKIWSSLCLVGVVKPPSLHVSLYQCLGRDGTGILCHPAQACTFVRASVAKDHRICPSRIFVLWGATSQQLPIDFMRNGNMFAYPSTNSV